ncbi:hypothetical protein [Variovorax sp. YR216]|uniref:hypothetical protein n=1 Tax=Variovorax sp. YR216 TaxID=1882828 RepID=UPI00089780DF|nr:hypothetical protein [Variovorax sp. YR216]SEB26316.1 hypothetical protein SAMN05444680_13116 [Variovorax sp. YR216]
MRTLIAGGQDHHGTVTAFSRLPLGYEGPCRMSYTGRLGVPQSVVFANLAEARLAATFAVQPDRGGYHTAELTVADTREVTHASCIDWICGDGEPR